MACTLLVAAVFCLDGIRAEEHSVVSATSVKGETGAVPDLQGSELLLGALILKGLLLKGHKYNHKYSGYHPGYYGHGGHGGYGGYGGYGGHGGHGYGYRK